MDDVFRGRATIVDQMSPALRVMREEWAKFNKGFQLGAARRDVEGLRGSLRGLGNEIRSVTMPAISSLGLAGGGVTLAVAGIATAVKGYAERIQDLGIASKELGLSVRNIRAFEHAAGNVRIAPQAALEGISTFKRNAEDFQLRIGSVRDELLRLGAGDVVERVRRATDTTEQLRITFARMEELQKRNPAVARRYAEMMFGSAQFARMGWDEFRKAFERVGDVTDAELRKAEEFNKQFNAMTASFDRLKQAGAVALLPGLTQTLDDATKLLDAINKLDAWANKKMGITGDEKGDLMGRFVSRLRGVTGLEGTDPMAPEAYGGASGPADGDALMRRNNRSTRPGDYRLPGFRSKEEQKETTKEGVKQGVIDGMTEYNQRFSQNGGGGGFMNASLGGTSGTLPNGGGLGGGGGKWGGGGYSLDGLSTAPSGSSIPRASGGGGSGGGAGNTLGGDTSGLTGNEFLRAQRARLGAEMEKNPNLKRRFAALVDLENPGAGTAVAESAMNRAAMTGRSLESILSGGPRSFYGPARRGMVEPRMNSMSSKTLAARYAQIDAALAGSNQIKGHTDQGSAGDPNYYKGGTGVNINRERFNDWGGFKGVEYSRRWREQQQAQVAASATASAGGGFNDRWNDRIDGALGGRNMGSPTGTVNVNVTAPPGTKTTADSEGLFKKTTIQRYKQMTESGLDGGGQ